MTGPLALTDAEAATVRAILKAHLPARTRAGIFGSRATGTCKPWSDLDLALKGDGPLSLAVTAALAEAFAESDLAWKVDIVDRMSVSEEFGRIIESTLVPFDLD